MSTTGSPQGYVELPVYKSEHLDRSPLVLVAAQINFEEVARDVSHAQARSIQKAVGGHWTQLMSAAIVTATMTPSGTVNEAPRQAYRLVSGDGLWSAQLSPDCVTVETRAYPGWEAMQEVIRSFADAVATVFDPANELRLGVRYVDQIPLPHGRDSWEGLIPSSLLGIGQEPNFGPGVLASDQRVLLQLAPDVRCVMRHGLLADAAGGFGKMYLLDFDAYRERPIPYDPASVTESAEVLHGLAGALFRASVTDGLYAWLKG